MNQVEEFLEAKRQLEQPVWASVLLWMSKSKPGGRKKQMEDGRKVSLYFSAEVLAELKVISKRTDQSVSRLLRLSWDLAKEELKTYPENP